jgi:hypothetical protein
LRSTVAGHFRARAAPVLDPKLLVRRVAGIDQRPIRLIILRVFEQLEPERVVFAHDRASHLGPVPLQIRHTRLLKTGVLGCVVFNWPAKFREPYWRGASNLFYVGKRVMIACIGVIDGVRVPVRVRIQADEISSFDSAGILRGFRVTKRLVSHEVGQGRAAEGVADLVKVCLYRFRTRANGRVLILPVVDVFISDGESDDEVG